MNSQAFLEISEIYDIIASAKMGIWRIELVDGREPCMYIDGTMKELLGITGKANTPEETYNVWFSNIKPEAVDSVLRSVERMKQGYFDENTYLWIHPTEGIRYVRCGGTAQKIEGGYSLRGYHYDVDDVVREDQAKVAMLKNALNDKNEYFKRSQTDELTGVLNRRAYEEDIYEHNDTPDTDEFTYISLDVNGLKIVNDTYGHMAGDELIIGACQCMKQCMGEYGKIYRIGGDEFVAILFCDVKKVKELLREFDKTVAEWKGKLIDSLSVSYGWISKEEEPLVSVRQLGAVAEARMYEAKSAHYRKKGIDRRGQQDAHKALCELYTKILKINISEDSYQIVNIDENELAKDSSISDKISEWLEYFGSSGNVHPDDLQEYFKKTKLQYIREYFECNKTSLHVFYRRKYGDQFKQVMMEIIPTNDYSDDNQTFFLYVREIDK